MRLNVGSPAVWSSNRHYTYYFPSTFAATSLSLQLCEPVPVSRSFNGTTRFLSTQVASDASAVQFIGTLPKLLYRNPSPRHRRRLILGDFCSGTLLPLCLFDDLTLLPQLFPLLRDPPPRHTLLNFASSSLFSVHWRNQSGHIQVEPTSNTRPCTF